MKLKYFTLFEIIKLVSNSAIFLMFVTGCFQSQPFRPVAPPPPPPTPVPQPTPITTSHIQITSPPQPGMTFLSIDSLNLTANIFNFDSQTLASIQMRWTIVPYEVIGETANEYDLSETNEATICFWGSTVNFTPNPVAAPSGRANRLYYETIFEILESGSSIETAETYFVQDYINQCRQEYVDFTRNQTPTYQDFINSKGSEHFQLQEFADMHGLNYYKKNAIYVQPSLTKGLENMRVNLGDAISINYAYRWPSTQYSVSASYPEGNHQYGLAADLNITDLNEDTLINSHDWNEFQEAAKSAGACVEPAGYANPEQPNYFYIHVDWREGTCPEDW